MVRKNMKSSQEKQTMIEMSAMKKTFLKKQETLLKAVEQRIQTMSELEIKESELNKKRELARIKLQANKSSLGLMKMIMEKDKLEPYDDCTDRRLLNFKKNFKYVKVTCTRYYGKNGNSRCMVKTNFCGLCCRHHVGFGRGKQLKKCNINCNSLLEGIPFKAMQRAPDDKDDRKKT